MPTPQENNAINVAAIQQRRLAKEMDLNPVFKKKYLAQLAQQAQAAGQQQGEADAKLSATQARARRAAVMTKPYDGPNEAFKILQTYEQYQVEHPEPPTREMWRELYLVAFTFANNAIQLYGNDLAGISGIDVQITPAEENQIKVFLNLNCKMPSDESYLVAAQILRDEGVIRRATAAPTPAAEPEPVAPVAPVNPHPWSNHPDSPFVRWDKEQLAHEVRTEQSPIFKAGALMAIQHLDKLGLVKRNADGSGYLDRDDVARLQHAVNALPMNYSQQAVAEIAIKMFGGPNALLPDPDRDLSSEQMKKKYGFTNSYSPHGRN